MSGSVRPYVIESGPAPRASSNGSAEAAPEAQTDTEGSLSALLRAIQSAGDSVAESRKANEHLAEQIELARITFVERPGRLETQLCALAEQRDSLLLEIQALKNEAARERAFLIDEQDRFLAGILEDHEQSVQKLRGERDWAVAQLARFTSNDSPSQEAPAEPARPATDEALMSLREELEQANRTISKISAERERAREVLRTLQSQRDDAQQEMERIATERNQVRTELATLQAERIAATRTLPHPGPPSTKPPTEAEVGLDLRRTDPMGGVERPIFSASPAFLEAQLALSRSWEQPALAGKQDTPNQEAISEASRQTPVLLDPVVETHYPHPQRSPVPLKQKPDPTTMPLGSYSLNSRELIEKGNDSAPSSVRPRRR